VTVVYVQQQEFLH